MRFWRRSASSAGGDEVELGIASIPSENLKRVEAWMVKLGVDASQYPRYRDEAVDIQRLSDDELVYVARIGTSGASAELTHRNSQAVLRLATALGVADNRLYRLTVLLTLYTVLIAILTILLIFHR